MDSFGRFSTSMHPAGGTPASPESTRFSIRFPAMVRPQGAPPTRHSSLVTRLFSSRQGATESRTSQKRVHYFLIALSIVPPAISAADAQKRVPPRGRRTGPIAIRDRRSFPTIGNFFSNHWKNGERFFQSLEKRADFSNHWKKVFQSLENSGWGVRAREGAARRGRREGRVRRRLPSG